MAMKYKRVGHNNRWVFENDWQIVLDDDNKRVYRLMSPYYELEPKKFRKWERAVAALEAK